MRRERDSEVLIAGAGPSGLAAAVFLKERGVDLAVVEPRWGLPDRGESAVILHPDNLQRLDDVGVEFDFAREARRVERIGIYEGASRKAELRVSHEAGPFACAAVVPLRTLHQKLLTRLEALQGEVRWHHRLARIKEGDDRLLVSVDVIGTESLGYAVAHGEEVVKKKLEQHPRFVIGADGRESLVRLQLQMEWEPVADSQIVAAFEADAAFELSTELRVALGRGASASAWPLPDGGVRLNFALAPHRAAFTPLLRRGELPDRQDLLDLVRAHLPGLEEGLGEIRWAYLEQVAPMVARPPQREHAWLLGEAAVSLLSLASQTLNVGLREAHDLAVAMSLELAGQASLKPLQNYASLRQSAHERAARPAGALGAASALPWPNLHPALLPLLPASGPQLDEMTRQLGRNRVEIRPA